eukprot:8279251-Pyramimonas_sp.AAC.1
MAQRIARALRRRGAQITAARSCVYLGVGLGGGRVHTRAQRTKRVAKHATRHGKVRRCAYTLHQAKVPARLATQGGQAVGRHGFQLHGALGQYIAAHRRKLGAA